MSGSSSIKRMVFTKRSTARRPCIIATNRSGRGSTGLLGQDKVVPIGQQEIGFAPLVSVGKVPRLRAVDRTQPNPPQSPVNQVSHSDPGVFHALDARGLPRVGRIIAHARYPTPLALIATIKNPDLGDNFRSTELTIPHRVAPGAIGILFDFDVHGAIIAVRRGWINPDDCVRGLVGPILGFIAIEGGFRWKRRSTTWWTFTGTCAWTLPWGIGWARRWCARWAKSCAI